MVTKSPLNLSRESRKTLKGFFKYSLGGVKKVLSSQLELAQSEGYRIQKVILTGGFGQSPSLQSSLRKFLKERKEVSGWDIDLVVPDNP